MDLDELQGGGIKIDAVGRDIVVYVNDKLELREPFPVPRKRIARKDRGTWLTLWAMKRLGADIDKATPRRLRRAL